jgi:hypothetical protein
LVKVVSLTTPYGIFASQGCRLAFTINGQSRGSRKSASPTPLCIPYLPLYLCILLTCPYAKQGAGSKTSLTVIGLVHAEIVGQFKIIECFARKPVSHLTVTEEVIITKSKTYCYGVARVHVSYTVYHTVRDGQHSVQGNVRRALASMGWSKKEKKPSTGLRKVESLICETRTSIILQTPPCSTLFSRMRPAATDALGLGGWVGLPWNDSHRSF